MSGYTDGAWSSNSERSQIFFLSTEVPTSALQAVLHRKLSPSFQKTFPNEFEFLKTHHKHCLFCANPFRGHTTIMSNPLIYPKIPAKLVKAYQASQGQQRREGPLEVFQTVVRALACFQKILKTLSGFEQLLAKALQHPGQVPRRSSKVPSIQG